VYGGSQSGGAATTLVAPVGADRAGLEACRRGFRSEGAAAAGAVTVAAASRVGADTGGNAIGTGSGGAT
jgi:hypothetical protein